MWAEQLQSEGSEARGLAEHRRHPLDLSFPLCCVRVIVMLWALCLLLCAPSTVQEYSQGLR